MLLYHIPSWINNESNLCQNDQCRGNYYSLPLRKVIAAQCWLKLTMDSNLILLFLAVLLSSSINADSSAIYNSTNYSIGESKLIAGEDQVSKENSNSTSGCTSSWHYCDNGTCTCGPIPPHDVLQCDNHTLSSYYWASYSTYTGQCLYNFAVNDALPNTPNELEDVMCGNWTGTHCGKCKDGHYPLAYFFDRNCVECSNSKYNWFKFVLAAFLPLFGSIAI